MAGENVQDMILQAVMLGLIGLAFILAAVNNSDPTQYFLRFYAKDLGTTVDAVQGSRGEVTLDYRSIRPEDRFIFDFSNHHLRLSAQQANETAERILWRVLQYYGTPLLNAKPPLQLLPETLYQPYSITILRNPAQVRFDNNPGPACAGAEDAIPKRDTTVIVTGYGLLANKVRQELNEDGLLSPPVITPGPFSLPMFVPQRYVLRLDIRELPETEQLLVGGGQQADLSQDLGCLLDIALEPIYENLTMGSAPVNYGIHTSILLPRQPSGQPPNELHINSTAQAVSAAVAAFLDT